MDLVLHILVWLVLLGTILAIPLGVPGTFFIALAALVEGLLADFATFGPGLVLWLFLIAMGLEGLEYLITGASARHYGASRAGIVGAVVGAIVGAVVGSGLLPVIGTLVGTLIGAYLGAVIVELGRGQATRKAFQAGFGAFIGSAGAKLIKIAGGVFMLIWLIRATLTT